MSRYLNVAERAMRALELKLREISPENGYNTHVQKIERLRQSPSTPPNPRTIYILAQQGEPFPWCNDREYERRMVQIWFTSGHTEGMDTEYELFKSDIRRCLARDIPDPTHPCPNQALIYVEYMRDVPLFMEENEPYVVGMIEYQITYAYTLFDDRLWDDVGDDLVEVEE